MTDETIEKIGVVVGFLIVIAIKAAIFTGIVYFAVKIAACAWRG